MIAGDPEIRNFPYRTVEKSLWEDQDRTEAALRQKAVGYNCLNYDQPANAALGLKQLPQNLRCKDGLRSEVFFPSCWNGKDVDSPDHRDHMRYPSLMDDGDCPKGFETRVVSLFYETIWDVDKFYGKKGQFVFSTGDPTGFGYHGDFMNAWDGDVLQSAINTCTSLSGEITACDKFKLYTEDEMRKCTIKPELDENVKGPLKALPGCNAVTSGPARAQKGGCPNDPKDGSVSSKPAPSSTKASSSTKAPSSTGTPSSKVSSSTKATPSNTMPKQPETLKPTESSKPFSKPSQKPTPSASYGRQEFDIAAVANESTASDPYLVIVTVTETITPHETTLTVSASQQTGSPQKKRGVHNHKRHHKF
jgi:Domain of unknown function (DUF1996)